MRPLITILKNLWVYAKERRGVAVAVSLVSLTYLLILLYYTHGSLLFDGDNYGFYHITIGLLTTPTGILEAFSLFASGSNIYVAFYIYLYLSVLIAVFGIYYLSSQLYVILLSPKYVISSALVSSTLYVITPIVLVDHYNSFIGNVSLSSSFFTLFLAFLIRSYRYSETSWREFLKSIGAASVFLGLSVTLFPNDIRILFVGYVTFASYFIFLATRTLIRRKKIQIFRKFLFSLPLFIGLSIFSSLFITYGTLVNIGSTVRSASVAASNFTYLGFYTGSFDTMVWVIRLIDTWTFPTGFVIYHSIYFHIDLVNIASFFWPILSLFIPLIVIFKFPKHRALLLYIMFLVICALFWEKSANPPFGSLWYFINSKLPFRYEFIPNGFLTAIFLAKIYPVLAVFSIVTIYELLKHIKNKPSNIRKIKRLAVILAPAFLASMLIVAELPVFDGQLEANYFNPE
ncbi:MAG: hypothetical protein QXU18_12650, partial [Thermoplasmatales archaeon]